MEEKKSVGHKTSLSTRCFYKKKKKIKASRRRKTRKGGKITTQDHVVQRRAVSVCHRDARKISRLGNKTAIFSSLFIGALSKFISNHTHTYTVFVY